MKKVWQWLNWTECAAFRPDCTISHLFNRNALDAHRSQTRDQKCGTEPFSNDFTIYLIGRFVDAHFFEHAGKLSVSDAFSHHLHFNQLFRVKFPLFIGLGLWATHTWQIVHYTSIVFKRPSLLGGKIFFCHEYRSYTTDTNGLILYVPANYFCENEMLNKILTAISSWRHPLNRYSKISYVNIHWPFHAGVQ